MDDLDGFDWESPFLDEEEAPETPEAPAPQKGFLDRLTSSGALLPPKGEEAKAPPDPVQAVPPPPVPSEEAPPEALHGALEACEEDALKGFRIESASSFLAVPPAPYDCIVDGAFERGDKVEVIAPSKCRKSFWVIGLALHVASGRDYCGMKIPKARRVLYINLELKPDTLKRRLLSLLQTYGMDTCPAALSVLNVRGRGGEVRDNLHLLSAGFDLVIVDPRYKLMRDGEDENTGAGLQAVLDCFDRIANTGAAVLVVAHDAKGQAGDRDARDRGAGSSWAGRDCDCRFTLTPHIEGEGFIVFEGMVRAFAPILPRTLRIEENAFFAEDDMPAIPETTASRMKALKASGAEEKSAEEEKEARRALDSKLEADKAPMRKGDATREIKVALNVGDSKARDILAFILHADRGKEGGITERVERRKGGGKLVGYPAMFAEMDAEITGR